MTKDNFVPYGREIDVNIKVVAKEGPKAYWTSAPTVQPDWNIYDYVWTVTKPENKNVKITNNSKV